MKSKSAITLLLGGMLAGAVLAQTPSIPPAPPSPPVQADAPATPVPPPPVTPAPPAAGKGTVAEGKLFRTERQKNDKGQFTWVCTYMVGGQKRAVALDESCPTEMTFELKR